MTKEITKTEITYDATALEIISNLVNINQSVVFEIDDDNEENVIVKAADTNKSIAYVFSAPKDSFGFIGEDCSFYNYQEFYNLFSLFSEPTLEQDETEIIIKEGNSKLKYRLTDRELIKKSFNKVKFGEGDISFIMDAELVKKIKNLSSKTNVNAEIIKFTVSEDAISYCLYNSKHPNTYEENLPIENEDDFEFTIENPIRIFNKIPLASYKVEMKEEGTVRFSMIREDDISVDIYTADLES